MKQRNGLDQVLIGMELPGEVPPGMSLIEIVGNSRILIENQMGVCSYSPCSVTVRVKQGLVCITGEQLQLRQMTKNQLVITGVVFGLSLTDWR